MAISPLNLARVSNLLKTNLATSQIGGLQRQLTQVQNQLSTGKRILQPSDEPGDASSAAQIRKLLEGRLSYSTNLQSARNQLSEVDSSLSTLTDLVREAQQVASQNVGSVVTSQERSAAAVIIDSLFSQSFTLANKSVAGMYLFAGDNSTEPPFIEEGGGVRWKGSSTLLQNQFDESTALTFMASGAEVFGALSTRVKGSQDLTPALTLTTRLSDVRGTSSQGVRLGTISINDGATTATLDLSDADNVDDVIERINAAGLTGVTASIGAAGTGITLSVDAGSNLVVTDVGGGTMAADLGIARATASGDGIDLFGSAVSPRVGPLTTLASLNDGAGISLAGLTITNGSVSKNINLSGAVTVEDAINTINNSGALVKAQINDAGTGIDILNSVQSLSMTISENGGTTAADLGVRSYSASTRVAELNDGKGLTSVAGAELRLTDSAGVGFDVDLTGVETVQDVLDRINAAATTAGAGVAASFATTGNGIVLTDSAVGAGTLVAANLNNSRALAELGLEGPVSGNTLNGRDNNPINSTGLFANLDRLRRALRGNDQAEITAASELIDADLTRVTAVRGKTGAQVQEFESRATKIEDQNVATQSLLSELEDTDYTAAISKYQTLQTALQASLQVTSKTLDLSLMDFLR